MSLITNETDVTDAYCRVRSDDTDETWLLLKYEGKNVILAGTGISYDEFLAKLGDDDRAYGYIGITTGDEMSKRRKFVFITWIGQNVSPLQRARVSTDKATVKKLICDFGVEKLCDADKDELKFEDLKAELQKASGANYGTGKSAE